MPILDEKSKPSNAWIEALRKRFPTERTVDETLTAKMRNRGGPPHRPQTIESVVERLTRFLKSRVEGRFEISDVRGLAGGSSKEQFGFTLTTYDNGARKDQRLVLRMRPRTSIVETHTLREFQAMRAVQDVLPVPQVFWCDPDGAELGQPALIAAFCEGITRPPHDGAYTPRQGFGPKYRALLAPQFVRHFAALGAFDWRTQDLSAFDPPPANSKAGILAQINWWERVWEEDCVEPYPLMTLTALWLREHAPTIEHISLLHNDFRGGNFLFRAEDGVITAMLDWELACLGDRHQDLSYFLGPLFTERDEDGVELVGGFLPRETFLREYERLSGLPVDPARLAYYDVYNAWRGIINCLATAPRIIMDEQTHQDIRVGWITNASPVSMHAMRRALEGKF